jgi:hypothetical protein
VRARADNVGLSELGAARRHRPRRAGCSRGHEQGKNLVQFAVSEERKDRLLGLPYTHRFADGDPEEKSEGTKILVEGTATRLIATTLNDANRWAEAVIFAQHAAGLLRDTVALAVCGAEPARTPADAVFPPRRANGTAPEWATRLSSRSKSSQQHHVPYWAKVEPFEPIEPEQVAR